MTVFGEGTTYDLLIVGHFTIDLVVSPHKRNTIPALGGSATYASIAAKNLNADVSVISKVGQDFPPNFTYWLRKKGVDLSGLITMPHSKTTSFILYYENDNRQIRLKNLAPKILPEDIPESLQTGAIHVAPIANELKHETIDILQSKTSILSLDIQGFIRRFNLNGDMTLGEIDNLELFQKVDILKASQDELKAAMGTANLKQATRQIRKQGVKIIVVTKGIEGSIIYLQEKSYRVPSYRTNLVRDRTGAGDVYMGSFLAEYIRGRDPIWCASVGSSAASFIIQEIGPIGLPAKKKIYERAENIFQRTTNYA